ncbi:ankyrin repeat domain-containing protein [Candidatus Uabimicrobium amorphum]|uniref:Cell division protein ZipA n=1 Tax=Uabimicrobium amorphum TaxID=2596890 RepID=A0A5S9IIM5_UABAM|nr:ankyrin repeat domain-containing protein [Candidatus Uabimicrobium amorphum]BBM82529.1 cell division protein ZipA [Candidatus Uabimicrobium amorphum]
MRSIIFILLVFAVVGCKTTQKTNKTTTDNTKIVKNDQANTTVSTDKTHNSSTQPNNTNNTPRNTDTNETQSSQTQPATTETVQAQPTTQPVQTQPVTQPTTTQPVQTQPATTQPTQTQPATTQPKPTKPTTQPSVRNNTAQIKSEAEKIRKSYNSLSGSFHPTTVVENFHFKDHLQFLVRANVRDDRGYNMLMLACEFGYLYIVQDILRENAQSSFVNQPSTDGGKTAVMIAADLGHADIVELLMINGANAKLKRDNGKTAIDFAQYRYENSTGQQQQKFKRILDSLQGIQGY